uniref:Pleckstrin homology domain containing B1 n=1 Tax=Rousettus aegyptiacus TaxID=9407 RepID=A0A7J8H4E4_ROUAE|nr:pleckstrin homology domain containing B1 [Rousettus aegyptiacus]
MALVRGGWLWRQSSILRRWKRNWFALWLDGTLGYYHDETAQDFYEVVSPNAHEATYVRSYYGPPYAGPGVTHVIVREDPCYSAGAPLAMGMLAGAATGAALGSLMWSPCWF